MTFPALYWVRTVLGGKDAVRPVYVLGKVSVAGKTKYADIMGISHAPRDKYDVVLLKKHYAGFGCDTTFRIGNALLTLDRPDLGEYIGTLLSPDDKKRFHNALNHSRR